MTKWKQRGPPERTWASVPRSSNRWTAPSVPLPSSGSDPAKLRAASSAPTARDRPLEIGEVAAGMVEHELECRNGVVRCGRRIRHSVSTGPSRVRVAERRLRNERPCRAPPATPARGPGGWQPRRGRPSRRVPAASWRSPAGCARAMVGPRFVRSSPVSRGNGALRRPSEPWR